MGHVKEAHRSDAENGEPFPLHISVQNPSSFEAVSWRQDTAALQPHDQTTDKRRARLGPPAATRVLQAANKWSGEDSAQTKAGDFPFFFSSFGLDGG